MTQRILIYGGCHAQIIRELLCKVLAPGAFELSLLVNFQLIASGKQFPYADLERYDVVIYSPIENHGDYNTDRLREACAAIGCHCICFPWLEWHGYCIGAQKGVFKGRHQWYYPELQALAERFIDFDTFYEYAVDNFPDDRTIDRIFNASTAMIRAAEQKHEMVVRISDFIASHFQANRLFFISDHPSLAVYAEIIAQILVALKCSPHAALGVEEPQWQLRTPIFPRVAKRIGLKFHDSDWVDHELMPGESWNLRAYLQLYYYPDAVILGPLENAQIFYRGAAGSRPGRPMAHSFLPAETRLYAQPAPQLESGALANYELVEILKGPENLPGAVKTFSINPNDWKSTWIA
jgi:hypothetical protein